jgi:hypothetical protein
MTAVVIQNTYSEEEPPSPILREDGTPMGYCMYFNALSHIAFADTYPELLDVLLAGYLDMTDVERLDARIRAGSNIAAQLQAAILFEEDVTPESVSEEEWRILTAPRSLPQPRADWWACPIPLVVVETAYHPYTDVSRPASALADGIAQAPNLLWIRPAEEEDFLRSLSELGVITLLESVQ